jgi:hypothetical protein
MAYPNQVTFTIIEQKGGFKFRFRTSFFLIERFQASGLARATLPSFALVHPYPYIAVEKHFSTAPAIPNPEAPGPKPSVVKPDENSSVPNAMNAICACRENAQH